MFKLSATHPETQAIADGGLLCITSTDMPAPRSGHPFELRAIESLFQHLVEVWASNYIRPVLGWGPRSRQPSLWDALEGGGGAGVSFRVIPKMDRISSHRALRLHPSQLVRSGFRPSRACPTLHWLQIAGSNCRVRWFSCPTVASNMFGCVREHLVLIGPDVFAPSGSMVLGILFEYPTSTPRFSDHTSCDLVDLRVCLINICQRKEHVFRSK